jgi:hypothetical protein
MADLDKILSETWQVDELASGRAIAGLPPEPWTPPTPEEEAIPHGPFDSAVDAVDEFLKKNPDFVSMFASGTGPAGPGGVAMGGVRSTLEAWASKLLGLGGKKGGTAGKPAGKSASEPTPTKSTPSETPPSTGTGTGEIVPPGGSQGPKTGIPEVAPSQPKPLYGMSLDELDNAIAAKKQQEADVDVSLFGEEGAKRFKTLERQYNSNLPLTNPEKYKQVEVEYNAMIDRLTPEQQDQLYGIGEQGPSLDSLKAIREGITQLDFDSPEALGRSLRYAVTKVGQRTNPAEMSESEQVAYAQLFTAFKYAKDQGWSTKIISEAAIKGSAQRFSDPEDAAFMLQRFMKQAEKQTESKTGLPAPKTATPEAAVTGKKPKPKGVQLLAGTPPPEAPHLIEHPITLGDQPVGELRINPATGEIEWLGNLETLTPLKLGRGGLEALGTNLASYYPNLGVLRFAKIKKGTGPAIAGVKEYVFDLNSIRRKNGGVADPVADAIKETVNEAVKVERIRQGDKRIQPNEVSKALGRELNLTEQQVLEHPEFENMAPMFTARVDLAKKAHDNVRAAYDAGNDDALHQFTQQYIGLQANAENFIGESARVVQLGRDEVFQWLKTSGDSLKQQFELHQSMYPDIPLSGAQIRKMIDAVGFDAAMKDIKAGTQHYFKDMWVSYWMSNAFSNVTRTAGINIENAYLNTLKQAASRELGAASQRVLGAKPLSKGAAKTGEREALVQGEGLVQLGWNVEGFKLTLKAIQESWKDGGFRQMYRDFITAPRLEHTSKLEAVPNTPAISSENVIKGILYHRGKTLDELDPDGLLRPLLDHLDASSVAGKAIDVAGKAIHTPLQALEQGDRASYQMLIYGARGAAAHARGKLGGLEGDALANFVAREVTNPSTLIENESHRLALHELYRDPIKTGVTKGIMEAVTRWPILRLAQLVYKTPFNMGRNMLEDLPGFQLLTKSVRDDYAAGGARASLAQGRMLFGSMAVSTYSWLAYNDRITGSGPQDPNARRLWLTTHKPNSIAVWVDSNDPTNKLWMPSLVFGSHAMLMSMVADITHMAQWSSATPSAIDDNWWDKASQALYYPVLAIAKDATNNLWMQGFTNLLSVFDTMPGDTVEKAQDRVKKFTERSASLLIPAHSLLKDMNVEVNTILDDLKATVPFWGGLKPKRDDFGDIDYTNMLNTMTGIGPVSKSQEMERVVQEVAKNAPQLRSIPKFLDGQELTGNEESEFKRIRGQEVRHNGLTMKDDLKRLIDSPLYQRSTEGRDGSRAALLAAHYNYFTSKALEIMGREDAKFMNLKDRIEKESRKAGRPFRHPATHELIGISP